MEVFGIGLPELIVIMAILLLLFGATRLPKLSRSAGQSISEFKKGMKGDKPAEKKPEAHDTAKPA